MRRIAGLETEYGCLSKRTTESAPVPERVRDHLFFRESIGLIDVHDRDYDEPAGNGGFLFNGGRLYVDMGHIEYCTAECLLLGDLLASDRAGETLLQSALIDLGLAGEASFIKNNIDHYTGATFGCHENYLLQRDAPLTQANVDALLAFLAVRGLMVGAGRVGTVLVPRGVDRGARTRALPFQVMQRADYIQTEIYEWVQFNRALINARDEPLGDPCRFRRFHLLLGDSNMLPFSQALKVGSTSLVLDLLEADRMPHIALADPVRTMHQISHCPDGPWLIELADGRRWTAVELLEHFLQATGRLELEEDPDTLWTCLAWEEVLRGLREESEALVGKVDWITKRHLLELFRSREGVRWDDPWMESLDLEYHNLDEKRSLASLVPHTSLEDLGLPRRREGDPESEAPRNTRAYARSQLMRRLAASKTSYVIDWDYVQVGNSGYYSLEDPFVSVVPPKAELPGFCEDLELRSK
ncbi:Pup--protein ligase [Methylacidimicrobium cyclopophantes]|uniref:Pup--protein ligase n=1 Tax=Methylacidimicrobium cyclopophantes TaxID=1041766 RepID=A0A5E6MIM6_9BACT|nr:proteasome accessory factor PafA2 family protein [Methylacidimicrobium cyclopophantes]VVM05351.1 Pup--protein ligase [Methylacidimicrobium cyclopophantes]